jgi:NADH-quinone oxidoreductase subunit M
VNYGPVTNPKNRGLRDLSVREWFVIAPVCAAAIFMGVVPGVFLKPMEASVKRTVEHVVGSGSANAKDQAPGLRPQASAGPDLGARPSPGAPALSGRMKSPRPPGALGLGPGAY